jgi:hypothetical protein
MFWTAAVRAGMSDAKHRTRHVTPDQCSLLSLSEGERSALSHHYQGSCVATAVWLCVAEAS